MITAMAKDALVTHFLNHWKKWAGGMCILILVMTFVLSDDLAKLAGYGAELPQDKSEMSPGARFFRDFVVFVIAAIGIVLAIRRAIDLNRQADTAEAEYRLASDRFQHQSEASTMQFKQAEKRMLSERFATAAELMAKEVAGKPAIAARVSGIHIMGELANAAPDIFLAQTLNTMVAYIKGNVRITATPPLLSSATLLPAEPSILGEDVKTAFAVVDGLFAKRRNGKLPGKLFPNFLDLSYADFSYLDLTPHQVGGLNHFKWERANFSGAILQTAYLEDAHLLGAIFHGADLSWAQLGGALLHNAELDGATLANANLQTSIVNQNSAPVEVSGASFQWAIAGAFIHFKNWDIRCFATDFSGAVIEKPPSREEKERMASQIWHNKAPGLEDIREQDKDHWLLESCSTSALVGAFRNFAERKDKYQDDPSERAKSFRAAVVKLGDKLPRDLSRDLREWVEDELRTDYEYGDKSL